MRRKSNLEKRLTQAKRLATQAENTLEALIQVAPFVGKSKVMDKAARVRDNANQLVAELMVDLSEERAGH